MNLKNLITFDEWQFIKHSAEITKGFPNFSKDELDEAVLFYDDKMKFLDYLERRKIENIVPAYVYLPKFFWENNAEFIPDEFHDTLDVTKKLNTGDICAPKKINLTCEAFAREEQKPAIETVLKIIEKDKNIHGIIQGEPGFGKTFISVKLTSLIGFKTLVVVPNEILMDQWVNSFLEFTNLNEEDIGLIQGSFLDAKNIEAASKDVVIVKIQSLYGQIKSNPITNLINFYKEFGLIFYDECHTSGAASSYAKTSGIFSTKNIIGLTATPYRKGLNEFLLKNAIGDVIFRSDHENLNPNIEIHNIYVPFAQHEQKRLNSVKGDYTMFLGIFNAIMKHKEEYFEYLADVVAWNKHNDYNIVVLFPTIALMENLYSKIEERHPDLISEVLLLKGKTKQDSLAIVKEKRKEIMLEHKEFKEKIDTEVKNKKLRRKEANEIIRKRRAEIDAEIENLKDNALNLYKEKINSSKIIISNYNLLSAGFDKPQMSNIIFGAAPRIGKVTSIQSIGRVTRKFFGKKDPLVQYFIPSAFLDFNKSAPIILKNNITTQYKNAKFKFIGFDNSNSNFNSNAGVSS